MENSWGCRPPLVFKPPFPSFSVPVFLKDLSKVSAEVVLLTEVANTVFCVPKPSHCEKTECHHSSKQI